MTEEALEEQDERATERTLVYLNEIEDITALQDAVNAGLSAMTPEQGGLHALACLAYIQAEAEAEASGGGMSISATDGCPIITDATYCPTHVKRGRRHRSPTTQAQRDGTGDYDRNRRLVLAGDPPCHHCGKPPAARRHITTPAAQRIAGLPVANATRSDPQHRAATAAPPRTVGHLQPSRTPRRSADATDARPSRSGGTGQRTPEARRMTRTCLTCGAPFQPTLHKQRRCLAHEPRGRSSRSPTTQAQDAEYQRERRRILTPGATCHWCPQPATTADHLVAVANGGQHRSNLVPACASCNASRGARDAPKPLARPAGGPSDLCETPRGAVRQGPLREKKASRETLQVPAASPTRPRP